MVTGVTTVYFGNRWDAPMLDGIIRQAATPVGQGCFRCGQSIVDGDRGLIRVCVSLVNGEPAGKLLPVHTECDMLGTIGHMYGVCHCTGYDTSTREAALELLDRVNANRAQQGMGPL